MTEAVGIGEADRYSPAPNRGHRNMVATQEQCSCERVLDEHETAVQATAAGILAGNRLRFLVEFDDLCQIGRIAIVQIWPRLDHSDPAKVRGYVRRRIYGAMVDHLRNCGLKSRGEYRLSQELPVSLSPGIESATASYTEELDLDGPLVLFMRNELLACVTSQQRQLLAEKFVHGKVNRQIAAERGCSETNVSIGIQRAIARIREHLKERSHAAA